MFSRLRKSLILNPVSSNMKVKRNERMNGKGNGLIGVEKILVEWKMR